ncbi:hypothetical protein [Algoriphagus sp.]|uniref:hypothetical protein n=1 Tax=Algoriphagus sp. TaxID=1872435 RepID=UPI00391DF9F8
MKNLLWIIGLLLFASFSCEDTSEKTYKLGELEELGKEIQALSESVTCTNSSEWRFTPMGSKACGGPIKYIAYHQSIEQKFLDLVTQYTKLQAEYNQKNNVISDCMLVASPKSVTCEGGKAILVN